MIFTPDIFDFSSAETFLKLQNDFLDHHNKSDFFEPTRSKFEEVQLEDFDINYDTNYANYLKLIEAFRKVDSTKIPMRSERIENIFFYKDFLKDEIPKLSDNEISKLNEKLNSIFYCKTSERKIFLLQFVNRLKILENSVYMPIFLNDSYKTAILNEIRKIFEFVYGDYIWTNEKDQSNKIKLKLSRAQITVLFFLLRQKGLTENEYDTELGRLIDDNFMYYNKKEDSYKEISRSYKTLNDYKNSFRLINEAAAELKELLSDDEFYELKQ